MNRAHFVWVLLGSLALTGQFWAAGGPIELSGQLEPIVDRFLIERLEGATLRLHQPQNAGIVLRFDRPWEGAFCAYATVIHDEKTYRLYYRGMPRAGADGSEVEVTCYAESTDGIHWRKPNLGLFEINGTRDNNVVLHGFNPASHNFSPFLDRRPGVPADQRYKAVGGTRRTGLIAFVSGDGLRWKKLREQPLITQGALDSQNIVFWSEHEQTYLCYLRTWAEEGNRRIRTISRATSTDFLNWSEPVAMTFGGTPLEQLYTSQTHPYFRAPHIYIAAPMRLMPGRQVLTSAQAKSLGVHDGYQSDCADAVFMSSRGGTQYDRTFMEGWIRPGTDLGNWASRAGLTALGIVPTGPSEMSIYKQAHYAQESAHLLRYTLRTDGFVSIHAPYEGGEFLTRPLFFKGRELLLNFSTSAAGGIRVELQRLNGQAMPGFSLAESREIVGDDIERAVSWQGGSDLSALPGEPVRLRFVIKDADLYSIRVR